MKIDNSRIFTADIHEVIDSTVTEKLLENMDNGDVFGSYSFDDKISKKGVVVVYFKGLGYVPVWHLRNILDYVAIKVDAESLHKKVLSDEPKILPLNGEKFLKNIQPLFSYPGKTSLAELSGIQKLQNDKDDTYIGMQVM